MLQKYSNSKKGKKKYVKIIDNLYKSIKFADRSSNEI